MKTTYLYVIPGVLVALACIALVFGLLYAFNDEWHYRTIIVGHCMVEQRITSFGSHWSRVASVCS